MSAGFLFPTALDYADTWSASASRPADNYLELQSADAVSSVSQASVAVDSLGRLVELLDEEGADDFGELGPSQHSFRTAFKLIEAAERAIRPYIVVGSPTVDSSGGIRMTWRRGPREIRLACPADAAEPAYLYSQNGGPGTIDKEIDSALLAKKLLWLIHCVDSL